MNDDLQATIASLREGDVVEVDVEYGTHRATLTGAVGINLEGRPHVWDITLPLARFLLAVRVIERASPCPNCVTPWKCNGPHVPWPPQTDLCECGHAYRPATPSTEETR